MYVTLPFTIFTNFLYPAHTIFVRGHVAPSLELLFIQICAIQIVFNDAYLGLQCQQQEEEKLAEKQEQALRAEMKKYTTLEKVIDEKSVGRLAKAYNLDLSNR